MSRCLGSLDVLASLRARISTGYVGAVFFGLSISDGFYDFWITAIIGKVKNNSGWRCRQSLIFNISTLVLAHVTTILGFGFEVELDRGRVVFSDVVN